MGETSETNRRTHFRKSTPTAELIRGHLRVAHLLTDESRRADGGDVRARSGPARVQHDRRVVRFRTRDGICVVFCTRDGGVDRARRLGPVVDEGVPRISCRNLTAELLFGDFDRLFDGTLELLVRHRVVARDSRRSVTGTAVTGRKDDGDAFRGELNKICIDAVDEVLIALQLAQITLPSV